MPTAKDARKLSAARSGSVSASQNFDEYLQLGNNSVGVWAVSTLEVDSVDLRSVDDSATGASQLTGHCFIDFRHCVSNGAVQRAARRLKDMAIQRGIQHPR